MDVFNRKMFRRIPFLTIFLLIWLVICFFYESAILRNSFISARIGAFLGISRSLALNGHFLRFATASFFHMNLGHFIGNAVGLLIFLTILEYVVGSYRASVIVLVSALGGAIAAIWLVNLAFSVAAGYMSLEVVDQGSHIGGLIAGAFVTIFIARGRSLKELQNPAGIGMKIVLIALVAVFAFSFYKEVYTFWPLMRR